MWAWIGLGIAVAAALFIIRMISIQMMPTSGLLGTTRVGSSKSGVSYPMMAPAGTPQVQEAYDRGTPTFAPLPIPPQTGSGGSAAVDLNGNVPEQRIIKTGQMSLQVKDTPKAIDEIRALVKTNNGFIESSTLNDNGSGPRSAWMTLRIPVTSFDATLAQLKSIATLVVSESVNGQDVTADFVDLEADLRNAKAEESSYLEILKRSGAIDDVLAVTKQLADVRGRIERLEGRKRFLSNRTDLATISVSLTEDTRIEAPSSNWRPLEVARQAFQDLIVGLQMIVNFTIRLVITVIGLLLPIVLLAGLLVWLGWKLVKIVLGKLKK